MFSQIFILCLVIVSESVFYNNFQKACLVDLLRTCFCEFFLENKLLIREHKKIFLNSRNHSFSWTLMLYENIEIDTERMTQKTNWHEVIFTILTNIDSLVCCHSLFISEVLVSCLQDKGPISISMGSSNIWCWRSFCYDGCFFCCSCWGFLTATLVLMN